MNEKFLAWVFVAAVVLAYIIRVPYVKRANRSEVVQNRLDFLESLFSTLSFVGYMVMPVIYIATEWFGDVDYRLPGWTGWLGIPLLFAALGLLWRAHADLGRNWSATVRIRAGHALVTDGVYAYVRHPIYAAHWLIVIAQVLLVQNWIAGPVGFLTFLLVYAYRIPREEAMLLQQYGDEYRVYMQHTGRVTPRWGIK